MRIPSSYILICPTMPNTRLTPASDDNNGMQAWLQPQPINTTPSHYTSASSSPSFNSGRSLSAVSCPPQLETRNTPGLTSDPLSLNVLFASPPRTSEQTHYATPSSPIPGLLSSTAIALGTAASRGDSRMYNGDAGRRGGHGRAASLPHESPLSSQKLAQSSMFVAVYQPPDAVERTKLWCI